MCPELEAIEEQTPAQLPRATPCLVVCTIGHVFLDTRRNVNGEDKTLGLQPWPPEMD